MFSSKQKRIICIVIAICMLVPIAIGAVSIIASML